jgi:hypothetical protein
MSTTSSWFEQLGYQIKYRSSTWFECLLQREGERWIGVGIDREAALADAVAKALPSAAARRAVEAALATPPPTTASAAPSGAATAPGATPVTTTTTTTTTTASATAKATTAAPAAATSPTASAPAPTKATPAAAPAAALVLPAVAPVAPVATAAATATASAAIPAPEDAAAPASAAPAKGDPIEAIDVDAAHAELDALERAIEENYVEASLLVAERQRLLLSQWMARGRAVQDAARGESTVQQRVYRISQRLGTLSKVWWPGNVKVLALHAKPATCSEDLDDAPVASLRTWRDVEDAAEAAMDRMEADAGKNGADDFGWCDGGLLQPGPSDPKVMLQAVVAALDRCTSPPVRRPQQALHTSEYAAKFDGEALGPASNWTELANRLRWLRGHVADFELWGAALGRLRWIASRDGDVHKATFRSLQPSFRPPTRWHVALGYQQRERRRRFDELVQQTPAADAPAEDFVRWIVGLFALADAIKSSDLERVTRPRRERIAELAPGLFAERHDRRRLRRLRQDLGLPALATDSGIAAEAGEVAAEAADAAAAAAAPPPAPGVDALIGPLREKTGGKRVLVVCNRTDAARDDLLRRELGFADVDHCGIESSRIHGKEQAVRNGSYDLVLAATGFLPHKVDGALVKACRAAGVPYVRINRGRFGQCLLHLARHFGLTAQYGALDGGAG